MTDPYASVFNMLADPATHARAVTPSDSTDLDIVPKALYVGVAGDVAMIGQNAPADAPGIVWKNVAAGTLLPFRPRRVLATNTTAASIVALY
jgi:hypothetical protein